MDTRPAGWASAGRPITGAEIVTVVPAVAAAGEGLDPLDDPLATTAPGCGEITGAAPRRAKAAPRCRCDGPAVTGVDTGAATAAGIGALGVLGAAAAGAESLTRTDAGGTDTTDAAGRLRPGTAASVRAPPERPRDGIVDVATDPDPEPAPEPETDPAPPDDPPEPRVSAKAAGIAATDMPTPSATANAPTRPT